MLRARGVIIKESLDRLDQSGVAFGRLASDDVTQDRLDIRGYINTVRKHGHNAMDVLHQVMAGTPWRPPAAAFSP